MKTIQRTKIPTGVNGDILHYAKMKDKDYTDWSAVRAPGQRPPTLPITWVDNTPFTATLTYESYTHSRASLFVFLTDITTNKKYLMKIAEFFRIFKDNPGNFDGNKITGTFAFERKGGVLGLVLLD